MGGSRGVLLAGRGDGRWAEFCCNKPTINPNNTSPKVGAFVFSRPIYWNYQIKQSLLLLVRLRYGIPFT